MVLVRGIDISHHQTVTSWSQVAADVDFCIVKATERASYVSPSWKRYFAAARSTGLLAGSYHFAGNSNTDVLGNAIAEARWYVAALRDAGWRSRRDLPPVLDIEMTSGKSKAALTAWCLDFMREVDELLNLDLPWLRCGFYANADYYNNRLDGPALHSGRWHWRAAWPAAYKHEWPPESAKGAYALWQFSDDGIPLVDGITGPTENGLDCNVALLADLQALAPDFYGDDDMPLTDSDAQKVAAAVWDRVLAAPESARRQAGWPEGFKAPAKNYLIGNDAAEVVLLGLARDEAARDQLQAAAVAALQAAVAAMDIELSDGQLDDMAKRFVRELVGEVADGGA